MDMQILAENMERRRKALGMTQQELADRIGISQVMVHRLLKGHAKSTTRIMEIAAALRCTPEDLFAPIEEINEPSAEYSVTNFAPLAAAGTNTSPADTIDVPVITETEIDPGTGATRVHADRTQRVRFDAATLRAAGVSPAQSAVCYAHGNSMGAVIPDGAAVGIDTGYTRIIDGEIYAVDHGGILRLAYLYRLPGGGIRLRSQNRAEYPDADLYGDDLSRLRIIGYVFWISAIRRRR